MAKRAMIRTVSVTGGSTPNRTLSAASRSPELVGADSSGDSAARRPRVLSAVFATFLNAAVPPAPGSRANLFLERVGDRVQDAVDVGPRKGQHRDGDHGDKRDDQRVLDERLAVLGPHLRQLNPRCQSLNHLALLSPSNVVCRSLLALVYRARRFRHTRERLVWPIPSA